MSNDQPAEIILPLTCNEITIGTAKVYPDGKIEAIIIDDTDLGKRIRQQILDEVANAMSFYGPVEEPVRNRGYNIRMENAQHVQLGNTQVNNFGEGKPNPY